MFLSTENQTKLKEKLIDQQKKLDKKFEKSIFLKQNKPVKITVQSDAGSIASYTSNKKPNNLLEEGIKQLTALTSTDLSLANAIQYSKQMSNSSNISKSSERINSSMSSSNSDQKRNSSRSARMSSTGLNTNQFKTSNEVLILIETWIKNAPNDFMDNQVLDEIKRFFNQLNNLNNSFKMWTSTLKEALRLDVSFIFNF